ncbi:MAG: hypothetical protein ACLGRW_06725 [Acidobacteriota bacterium]|jgi:hypothetical protein
MNFKRLVVPAVGLLIGFTPYLYAQLGEITTNYSLVMYNPAESLAGGRNLNGGGGSIGITLGSYLTMKGEFQRTATTTFTYHLPNTPNSTEGTYQSQGGMFTYLFGPQFNLPIARKRLFGEALFGGANTDAYANLFRNAHVTGLSASKVGFAMAFGGGIDFEVSPHIGLRAAQFDYFMTRYEWKPLGINNQSNFRYQAGLLFVIGKM